ncbi:MAG: polysaccharide biosynthesis C-terminal domain-containing protein [Kineosporiaceae bacterium]|nr:polysaccharide biosynthesis C-terminal domain-containing protein [Kineosporiaceae bacterium]
MAADSNHAAWRIVQRGSLLISPTLAVAALGIALAPSIVSTVLGQGYTDSILPLRLLLAGVAFGAMGQLLVNFLQTRGQANKVARAFMATLAIQVALVIVLTPRWGAVGVASAMASANAFASIVVYLGARRFVNEN